MDIRKGIIGLIPIIIIFLLTAGAGLYFVQSSLDDVPPPSWSGVCAQDVKQCSDGSYVGRVGFMCRFAACPDTLEYPSPGGGSGTPPRMGCASDAQCSSSQVCVVLESIGTIEPEDDGGGSFIITKGECRTRIGGACAENADCGEGVCYSGVCTQSIGRQCNGPNDMTCGGAYECVRGCGPPVVSDSDTSVPSYSCQMKGYQRPCPICLAENTAIATPTGEIAVQDMREGMMVWTQDVFGARVAAEVLKTSHTPAPSAHRVVHLTLEDGRELLVSPGHPTADGRIMGDIQSGDTLDGSRVATVELVSYEHNFTYDLFPRGTTGFYWADEILIGSTLSQDQ